jgi:hypothetical protein
MLIKFLKYILFKTWDDSDDGLYGDYSKLKRNMYRHTFYYRGKIDIFSYIKCWSISNDFALKIFKSSCSEDSFFSFQIKIIKSYYLIDAINKDLLSS